jgi:hypothetical protein
MRRSAGLAVRRGGRFVGLGHFAGSGGGRVAGLSCCGDVGVAVGIAFGVLGVVGLDVGGLGLEGVVACPCWGRACAGLGPWFWRVYWK